MTKPDFTTLTNLANPRLGASVVFATDDFFADKSRLIAPKPPVFIPDKYDDNGKWMDGWESRRKRAAGHDFAIIKLGGPARIDGLEIDTSHFTGNFPPFAKVEAALSSGDIPPDTVWQEIAAKCNLSGDNQHYLACPSEQVFSHIRLHIYPDGGVARLRVYGQFFTDWKNFDPAQTIDLAALGYGGRAVGCNNAHFGVPENMIAPGRGINMGDGWETRRRRTPGHDWAVLALAHAGEIERVIIDTAFFKGNYPDRVSLQAVHISNISDDKILAQAQDWPVLLETQKLEMNREHEFTDQLQALGPLTHVRVNIFPDGGISRLRLFGKITD